MNKQSKQFFIKLAIVVGVLILSAFITSVYGFFTPNHGDVSLTGDRPGGIPGFYTYDQFKTPSYMCCNTGASDGSNQLRGPKTYKDGSAEDAFEEDIESLEARESVSDYFSLAHFSVTTSGTSFGVGGQTIHVSNIDSNLIWETPTPKKFIGTVDIKVGIPDRNRIVLFNSSGTDYELSLNGTEEYTYTPPWQQAGGLGGAQLKKLSQAYNN